MLGTQSQRLVGETTTRCPTWASVEKWSVDGVLMIVRDL